ncbi:MAG: hypothetical protein AMJ38_03125 [Dehalococcoidia bacterium DG_22]|nr:MAG: hypothetical protein AMJ38_03125 [Dehalococcoidia bacterium DG_22]
MSDDAKKGQDFSADQIRFALWLALPRYSRKPRSQVRWAEEHGFNATTLSKWKRKAGFADVVHEFTMAELGGEWPQTVHAMVRESIAGNVEAAKFVGKVAGRYTDRLELGTRKDRPLAIELVTSQ